MSSHPSPEATLRVGVVGAGRIARDWHLPTWAARSDAEVRWIVDTDRQVARDTARSWNVPYWTTDLGEMLRDHDVTIVDLCTPPEVHASQAVQVLTAGRHLLVEKPAACSVANVQLMADAATEADVVAMVAENWMHGPGMRRARRLLADGHLGLPRAVAVTIDMQIAHGRRPDQQRSFLLNGGVHAVNAVRALLGDPTHVTAFTLPDRAAALTGRQADTDIVAVMRFAGERMASLHMSGHSHRPDHAVRRIKLQGTRGEVEFDAVDGWLGQWTIDGDEALAAGVQPDSALANPRSCGQVEEIAHFVAAIRGTSKPHPSLSDQVRCHQVLDALWASARDLRTMEVTYE